MPLVNSWPHVACAVALAFEAQMVDEVPMNPNDRAVDIVVTGQHLYHCSSRGQQLLNSSQQAL